MAYKKLLKIMVLISYMIVQGKICSLTIIGSSKINIYLFRISCLTLAVNFEKRQNEAAVANRALYNRTM